MDKVLRKTLGTQQSQQVTQRPAKDGETKESNITSLYQQKKRLIANDSAQDHSPSLKKCRRSVDVELTTHPDQPIIAWESPPDTNVDCQLKLSESIGLHNSQQQDTSQVTRSNECKMDQMLNEFHAKLQFQGLSREEDSKEEDSGNSESDVTSDDESWLANKDLKDLNKILKEPDENRIVNKPNSSPSSTASRESGIGSCDSSISDLNKPERPLLDRRPVDSNADPRAFQSPSTKSNLFKVPETPNKPNAGGLSNRPPAISTAANSVQFFSTPKAFGRQRSMNQTLNFENLSPIKSDCIDNNLINLRSDNKRAMNDSLNEDSSAAAKRRNGKVLFKSVDANTRPAGETKASDKFGLKIGKEDDLFDDSIDQILSQMDDKAIMSQLPKVAPKVVPKVAPTVVPTAAATNRLDDFDDDDDSFDLLMSQMDNQMLMSGQTTNHFNVHVHGPVYRQMSQASNPTGNPVRSQPANKQMGFQMEGQPVKQMGFQLKSQPVRPAGYATGRPVISQMNHQVNSHMNNQMHNQRNSQMNNQINNQMNGRTLENRARNGQTNPPVNRPYRYSANSQVLNRRT